MKRPLIGIVASLTVEERAPFSGMERNCVSRDYVEAVERAGGIPLVLPTSCDDGIIEEQIGAVQGILLSGGCDIHPRIYGEEPHGRLEYVCPEIDRSQLRVTRVALERGRPLLGICRGCQLLNVACGGTLYQDLTENGNYYIKHRQEARRHVPEHRIIVRDGTLLHELLGPETEVNSFHHQCVRDLGNGLRVAATSPDGLVEAIEMEGDIFVVGVQWHPEMMMSGSGPKSDEMLGLLGRFVEEARN